MSATAPTARDIVKGLLHPAMEGFAQGQRQTRLIWNPSPEADSLLEYLAEVQAQIPPEVLGKILALVKELLESNLAEGSQEKAVAGFADQMARTMRHEECNGA